MQEHKIQNPIIPGFYPDPSICRVGEDYYICCSSFEAYPGLPIFHSKDLANWEQIGYAMTKENGFHVDVNSWAGGVMAPTIRYHKGTYYIINCNFADDGNFIITAKDPAGPWSEPHWLKDVPGIDASFFFDEDDKCYIIGTGDVVKRADGKMERGIWAAEYDIENYKLIGEPVAIWDSALRNASSPESPHLYHIGDYYYLMIAEGGTEHYHCVAVARSKDVLGWYEGNPANPVMTHRMLGFDAPIANVGHADFVETQYGDWYAVMLASRTIDGYYKNFGRETYICPVKWEREWPVFSPGTGMMEFEYPADEKLPWTPYGEEPERTDFDTKEECEGNYPLYMTAWGTPYRKYDRVADSHLYLKCIARGVTEPVRGFGYPKTKDGFVAMMGRRQRYVDFTMETKMTFVAKNQEAAGLIVMQASDHQYLLQKVQKDGRQLLQLVLHTSTLHGLPWLPGFGCEITSKVLEEVPYDEDTVILRMQAKGQDYTFSYGADETTMKNFQIHGDGRLLNPEEVGPMAGTLLAMFATGNGVESENEAAFDYFEVKKG